MAFAAVKYYSPEEYLAAEEAADFKSEYIDGEIWAMAGGTPDHSSIGFNLGGIVHRALRGSRCRGYNADLKVGIPASNMYTYPDLSIVCGPTESDPLSRDVLINPTVLFEVLSPSAEGWDRGGKFAHYRQLPSLQEYVLISQDKALVERFVRRGEEWVFSDAVGLEATMHLESVPVTLPLAELYDGVAFPEQGAREEAQP